MHPLQRRERGRRVLSQLIPVLKAVVWLWRFYGGEPPQAPSAPSAPHSQARDHQISSTEPFIFASKPVLLLSINRRTPEEKSWGLFLHRLLLNIFCQVSDKYRPCSSSSPTAKANRRPRCLPQIWRARPHPHILRSGNVCPRKWRSLPPTIQGARKRHAIVVGSKRHAAPEARYVKNADGMG